MKTNKSFSKRIKITRKGKLIARKPGQNHFNARQTGAERSAKRGANHLTVTNAIRRRYLSY
jgi:ribosomal protein L35